MNKYTNGLQMEQFKHIEQISSYNNNYFIGFDKDLLFAKSDDDNTTEWYLVKNKSFQYLGDSYEGENNILHLYKENT
jgi:hypothetical protein